MSYALPFAPHDRVIELGGGHAPMAPGHWPNVDVREGPGVDLVASFERPLPLASADWDGVVSKFAAEHISWRTVDAWFAECHRILKPGGVLVLVVPNLLEQMRLNVELGDSGRWRWDGGVAGRTFGDLNYEENGHKSGWSPDDICTALRGFTWAMDPPGVDGVPSKDGKFVQTWPGFASVLVVPFGELRTDMIVESRKAT
jgi:SAM-dependent methyltransferase